MLREPTEIEIAAARKLVSGDFGTACLKMVCNSAVPVFWCEAEKKSIRRMDSGTTFFIKSSERLFGVTANHVVAGFITDREKAIRQKASLLPKSFDSDGVVPLEIDLETRIIARNADYDLATYEISEEEIEALGVSTISIWPPQVPEVGKGILFVGYPGCEIDQVDRAKFEFHPFPGLGIATSVSDRQVSIVLDRTHYTENPNFPTRPVGMGVGGMSGGPILTLIQRPDKLDYWAVGGVITEGKDDWGLLKGTRADVINSDGTFVL